MSDAGAFVGRFHPLLVHFPIALLLLAGLVELVAARRGDRSPWAAAALVPLLVLAALAAALAATAGYLLGSSLGYGGPTYDRHLQAGVAVAIGAAVTAALAWRRRRAGGRWALVFRTGLVLTLGLLTVAGHLGATLTHGEGYLTEHAPTAIRGFVATVSGEAVEAPFTGPAERAPIYPALVRPILRRHCVSCHGGAQPRGGLALDAPQGIVTGGDHGPALVPERAIASRLVQRVWLPPGHADAMPPPGHRPLAAADAGILRWWIDSGASFDATLADVEIAPELLPAIEARLGPIGRGGPTLPAVTLAPLDAAQLAAIRARGVDIGPIADGSPFLQVRLRPVGPDSSSGSGSGSGDDARVAGLAPVAAHVLWLNLAGSGISEAAFPAIGRMPNLTRLDVSRTATTDAGLRALGPLAQLEFLNLYGTRVTDAGVVSLTALPRLRRLYLWQTEVSPAAVERLKAHAPKLDVVLGADPPP